MIHGILKTVTKPKNLLYGAALLWVTGWAVKSCKYNQPEYEADKQITREMEQAKQEIIRDSNESNTDQKTTYHVSESDFKGNQKEVTQDKQNPSPSQEFSGHKISAAEYIKMAGEMQPDIYNYDDEYRRNILLHSQILDTDHTSNVDNKFLQQCFDAAEKLEIIEKSEGKESVRNACMKEVYTLFSHLEYKSGKVYQDQKGGGLPTVGVGFNMKKPGAERIWNDVFGDEVSFDNVLHGKTSLNEEQIYRLFETDMTSVITFGKPGEKNYEYYPGYYAMLQNHMRAAGGYAMEDLPYPQQIGLLNILFHRPGVINSNPETVQKALRVFCDPNATQEQFYEAGNSIATLYETNIMERDGTVSGNIQNRTFLNRKLLCNHPDNPIESLYSPAPSDVMLKKIQHRLHIHGESTGLVRVNIVGDLKNFKADDLKSLDVPDGKKFEAIIPRERKIIRMDQHKNLDIQHIPRTNPAKEMNSPVTP